MKESKNLEGKKPHELHTTYVCSECGLGVIMIPNQDPIRGCKHTGSIHAHMAATVLRQKSGLTNGSNS